MAMTTASVVGIIGPDDAVHPVPLAPVAVQPLVQPPPVHVDELIPLKERVQKMMKALDIPEEVVKDLLAVSGTDIVVIADDSGSMNLCVEGDVAEAHTRWDELKFTLRQLVHMLLVVDHTDGFNVQFLNEPTWHRITCEEQVDQLFFGRVPAGGTPLLERMTPVLSGEWHPKVSSTEQELFLIVMTDGEPSDCSFPMLKEVIEAKKKDVTVSFLMCTDEEEVVRKYNKFIDRIPGVDITDDYRREKNDVAQRGKSLPYYEWLAKVVIGGKLAKYDSLDDPRLSNCACNLM